MHLFKTAALSFTLLLVPAFALGQGSAWEMSASADGRGSVLANGQRANVSKAEVSLRPDGKFIVTLSADQRFMFRGNWRRVNDRIVQLTVEQSPDGVSATTGTIRLRRGRFDDIEMRSGRQRDAIFNVTGGYHDFTAGGTQPEAAPPRGRISAPRLPADRAPVVPSASTRAQPKPPLVTTKGDGRVTRADWGRRGIEAMEIFLREGGELHLKVFGSGFEGILTGSWQRSTVNRGGRYTYLLKIANAFSNRASGSGTVTADAKGRPTRLVVQGRYGRRQSYSVEFSPK